MIADVPPAAVEAIRVYRLARLQPRDEVPGLVARISRREIAVDQPDMIAREEIGRRRGQRARRIVRLLDECVDPIVRIELDDAVLLRQLAIADVVDGDAARPRFAPPEIL